MLEKNSEEVFGKTFSAYSKREINIFLKPLIYRLKLNKINIKKLVKGKKVLDLGCGNGRGALLMASNGAKEITVLDISKKNITKTKNNLKANNFDCIAVHTKCEKIPLPSNYFDFVWCNGVLMHTDKPDKSLNELNRILKKNSFSFIYVYGAGGLYWLIIDKIRDLLKNINTEKIIKILKNLHYSNRYIGEYLDDWKCLNLRRYKKNTFIQSLKKASFKNIKYLSRGLNYDTSEKLYCNNSKKLFGEGDLRFIVQKNKYKKIINNKILRKDTIVNNSYHYKYQKIFLHIKKNIHNIEQKIFLFARMQYKLRQLLSNTKFEEIRYLEFCKKISSY
jgi:ubiquinone/menaquinone biosynthesis C-methylase UbiE